MRDENATRRAEDAVVEELLRQGLLSRERLDGLVDRVRSNRAGGDLYAALPTTLASELAPDDRAAAECRRLRGSQPADGGTSSSGGASAAASAASLVGSASGRVAPAPIESDDPMVGSVIDGKFRILAPLGAGGMATVYRAWHLMLEKVVAIKFIHPDQAAGKSFRERFFREARGQSAEEFSRSIAAFSAGGKVHADVPTGAGRYEFREALSWRSLGDAVEVWRVRDKMSHREGLLWVTRQTAGGISLSEFAAQMEVVKRLQHRVFAPVIDAGTYAGQRCYAFTEVAAGVPLVERLRQGPAPEEEVLRTLHPLVEAFCRAHELGVCHTVLDEALVSLTDEGPVVYGLGVVPAAKEERGDPRQDVHELAKVGERFEQAGDAGQAKATYERLLRRAPLHAAPRCTRRPASGCSRSRRDQRGCASAGGSCDSPPTVRFCGARPTTPPRSSTGGPRRLRRTWPRAGSSSCV